MIAFMIHDYMNAFHIFFLFRSFTYGYIIFVHYDAYCRRVVYSGLCSIILVSEVLFTLFFIFLLIYYLVLICCLYMHFGTSVFQSCHHILNSLQDKRVLSGLCVRTLF